jgi:hypothetical protein
MLGPRPCCPEDLPADVTVRALEPADWPDVRRIYGEGIATGHATFEAEVPERRMLDATWLPRHRWVAEADGHVVGWAAAAPVSTRSAYSGVAETSIYIGDGSAAAASAPHSSTARSPRPTPTGSGPCRPRSSPRTGPASPCTAPPGSAPSGSANASAATTAPGATPSSWSAAAPTTDAPSVSPRGA